jgi:lipopolysaccharide transport system ATP-binding protein
MDIHDKEVIIKVEGLYKKFCRSIKRSMYYGFIDIARNMLGIRYDTGVLRKNEFWSLENINFDLKKGEALGIIGQNGSGKSTLLRLINGIYPPDKGMIMVKGRIGALIAVGAGFHPHLTGRENIFLNGTILGMSREEIESKFEDIVAFADLGEFMDAPVATYSSGMYIRLGFSIAIHSEPEILLADEVLAVGDLSFALKCYRKIAEYRDNGGSIILVSHGMSLIRNTCNKVIWMEKGAIKEYGETRIVCDHYESFMMNKDAAANTDVGVVINNDPLITIPKVEFLDKDKKPQKEYLIGEPFTARIHYSCGRKVNNPIFSIAILNPENITLLCNFTNLDGLVFDAIEGEGYIDFNIDKLPLKPSEYRCTITFAENGDINNILEWHDKGHPFLTGANGYVTYGLVNPFPSWELKTIKE